MVAILFSILPALGLVFFLFALWSKLNENRIETALRSIKKNRCRHWAQIVEETIAGLIGIKGRLPLERHDLYGAGYLGALTIGCAGYLITGSYWAVPISSLAGLAAAPRLYKKYRLRKLRIDFMHQLGFASDAMVNAMVGGATELEAMEYTAYQMKGEVSSEFKRMAEEIRGNMGLDEAVNHMAERVDMEEVYDFADSLSLLHEAKGEEKAIKLLRSASDFIKEKALVRDKVASYTSSIRFGYIASIVIVGLIAVFLYAVMPEYRWVFSRIEGKIVALICLALLVMGYWMVQTMIKNSQREI